MKPQGSSLTVFPNPPWSVPPTPCRSSSGPEAPLPHRMNRTREGQTVSRCSPGPGIDADCAAHETRMLSFPLPSPSIPLMVLLGKVFPFLSSSRKPSLPSLPPRSLTCHLTKPPFRSQTWERSAFQATVAFQIAINVLQGKEIQSWPPAVLQREKLDEKKNTYIKMVLWGFF